MDEFENVPGTWSYELKKHWDAFSENCWKGFNSCCEEMRKTGHENKISKESWRQYLIWDMQRRHDEEEKSSK